MDKKSNKHRYYDFVIRHDYQCEKSDMKFNKGDRFQAIVSCFVSQDIELYSFIKKDGDTTFVIPCKYVKFVDE